MAPASCAGSSARLRSAPPRLRNPGSVPAGLGLRGATARRPISVGQVVLLYHLHTMTNHYHYLYPNVNP